MSDKLPTITVTSEKSRRLSHQPKTLTPKEHKLRRANSTENNFLSTEIAVRRTSTDKVKRSPSNLKKPSVPDIPEDDQNEDGSVTPRLEKADSNVRVSFTKNNGKISSSSRSSRLSTGYVNEGYDQSNGSSIQGSMASLP